MSGNQQSSFCRLSCGRKPQATATRNNRCAIITSVVIEQGIFGEWRKISADKKQENSALTCS